MAPLHWHAVGLGAWAAWAREDGTYAPVSAEVTATHLGYRLVLRDHASGNETLTVSLNHGGWTIEQAHAIADRLIAEVPLPTGEPGLAVDLLMARLLGRYAVARECRMVHAFPIGADDRAFCRCGRVTRAMLRRTA